MLADFLKNLLQTNAFVLRTHASRSTRHIHREWLSCATSANSPYSIKSSVSPASGLHLSCVWVYASSFSLVHDARTSVAWIGLLLPTFPLCVVFFVIFFLKNSEAHSSHPRCTVDCSLAIINKVYPYICVYIFIYSLYHWCRLNGMYTHLIITLLNMLFPFSDVHIAFVIV